MIFTVIQAPNYLEAKQQLEHAIVSSEGIELRLDYWESFNIDAISALRKSCELPIIFTLRKASQGGLFKGDETERLEQLSILCGLNPDYIDLEYDVPKEWIRETLAAFPHLKIICSYHDFEKTTEDLDQLLESIKNPLFYSYKIATQAQSAVDALRMMRFVLNQSEKNRLTGICMGEHGKITRILSNVMGNQSNYVCLDEAHASASGQLTLDEALDLYYVEKHNRDTRIYALLGFPVSQSVGHILHNRAMQYLQKNAVYIKIDVAPEELLEVLSHCKELPFSGFSITMPHKEALMSWVDVADEEAHSIQAINSVCLENNQWVGFNTDGMGALQSLKSRMPLLHQKIVILGAGGAARAIAHEALLYGAEVLILNRTQSRAEHLARSLGCRAGGLDNLSRLKEMDYTVLVNTLPQQAYKEASTPFLLPDQLRPQTYAMDVAYQPANTPFLDIAKSAECLCISGGEMYIAQALLQIQRWFSPSDEQLKAIHLQMKTYFGLKNINAEQLLSEKSVAKIHNDLRRQSF